MTPLKIKSNTILSIFFVAAGLLPVVAAAPARAAAAKPKPDVLVFSNGDKLTGKLDHEAGGKVFFKSDNAGMVQVPWAKLKALRTEEPFAVIETGVVVGHKRTNLQVPVGNIQVEGDTLTVATAQGAQQVPIARITYLVIKPAFDKNVRAKQGLFQGVTGTVAAGVSTVYSTQNSVAINSAVALIRAVPPVAWMPARQRTILGFSSNYGKVTQPNTATAKTNIVHGDIEQDKYLSPRFYALGRAAFDHNYSQGLDLQQLYGLGVGYTVIKSAKQTLDVTGIVDYEKQQFSASVAAPATSNNIIGSSFGDTYMRNLPRKIVFTQTAAINPAWNSPADYSANFAAGAVFPVYKNLGFSAGIVDAYLNDPPIGFKGNSFQFNTALTYAIHR